MQSSIRLRAVVSVCAYLTFTVVNRIHLLLLGFDEIGGRPEILTLTPAPIQLQYLVYIGTTGSVHVPLLVTDPVATAPDTRFAYTEHMVYLPMYQARTAGTEDFSCREEFLTSVLCVVE